MVQPENILFFLFTIVFQSVPQYLLTLMAGYSGGKLLFYKQWDKSVSYWPGLIGRRYRQIHFNNDSAL